MLKQVRVDWREGWGNSARFECLFDSIDLEPLRYKKIGSRYLAIREDGYASFWSWKGPDNDRGCGGREFPITMEDGSTVVLKGPWSSNSESINASFGEGLVAEANCTDDPVAFKRGYTFCSASITREALVEYVRANPDCGFRVGLVSVVGGTYVLPLREDGTSKSDKDTVLKIYI